MDNLAKLPFKYESEINIISRKKNPGEIITDKHSVKTLNDDVQKEENGHRGK